ncbi:hypothetical protein AB2B38_007965 [Balneola sp. MJW-20]|uniref:hypothetical protein n=1 Tax=Gracilimonas aurantiaca TaxID=3234185 RepID=UPI003465FA29
MKQQWKILAGGVVTTSVLFAVPAYFYAQWMALILSFISAVSFSLILLKRNKEKLDHTYKVAATGIILLIIFSSGYIVHDYFRAEYQDEILVEIRQTIDSGIIGVQIKNDMIQSLKYYKSSDSDEMTVSEAFSSYMGDKLNENGTIKPSQEKEGDNISYHYEIKDADTVVIIAVTKVSKGNDPAFKNYDGQTGMGEYVGTLSNGGVEYEKVN